MTSSTGTAYSYSNRAAAAPVEASFSKVFQAGPAEERFPPLPGALGVWELEDYEVPEPIRYEPLSRGVSRPYRIQVISQDKARDLLGISRRMSISKAIESKAPHLSIESAPWAQEMRSFKGSQHSGPARPLLHLSRLSLRNPLPQSLQVSFALQEIWEDSKSSFESDLLSRRMSKNQIWTLDVASNASFCALFTVVNESVMPKTVRVTENFFSIQEENHGLYPCCIAEDLQVVADQGRFFSSRDSCLGAPCSIL